MPAKRKPAVEPAAAEDITTSAAPRMPRAAIFLGDSVEGFSRDGCGPHETPGGWLDCPDCIAYLRGETA